MVVDNYRIDILCLFSYLEWRESEFLVYLSENSQFLAGGEYGLFLYRCRQLLTFCEFVDKSYNAAGVPTIATVVTAVTNAQCYFPSLMDGK